MVNEETRAAVVALHKQGMRNPAIVKMLDLHRNKVKRIVDRFEATGEIKDRHRSGRPRTARTAIFRKAIKAKIQRNPARSTRKLAKEHGNTESAMERSARF
ncbi:hypothetical protein L596_016019 [Steinernema carpocapsae]|uniref:Paired domain-containing protein n=1 Tax=Steinernema carpocapsae TaxID=34508 RepID=A0A4U5NHT2_STECR|nr:hypothetical protein L596_016019 [Steinernema carpocapsae]